MKITDVEVIPLSFKIKSTTIEDEASQNLRKFALIKVHTDEGITGIGESSDCYGHQVPLAIKEVVDGLLKHVLIGENPFNIDRLWRRMFESSYTTGATGTVVQAISGLDIALWDILGKAKGEPVYKMLGSHREEFKMYASTNIGLLGTPLEEQAKEAVRFVEEGFNAIKVRGKGDPKWDVEMVKCVRDAVGDDVDLMFDAFMHYTPATAIWVAKKLEKCNLFFFEEPLPSYDIEGLARVAASVDVPIAVGEHIYTKYGFKNLIMKGAADIFQPDSPINGGLSECKKICVIAETWDIPCVPHAYASAVGTIANMHLIASTPNCLMGEYDVSTFNPLRDELLTEPDIIKVKKGRIRMPKKPGLGIELDEETVAKYRYK